MLEFLGVSGRKYLRVLYSKRRKFVQAGQIGCTSDQMCCAGVELEWPSEIGLSGYDY